MKKLLLVFVAVLTLASCDNNDDYTDFYYEIMPTENADIETTMEIGKIYRINLEYIQPTDCYQFVDLDYRRYTEEIEDADGSLTETQVRIVRIINRVYEEDVCEESGEVKTPFFDFEPIAEGPYVFRFWIGEDEEGEDIFLEYESEVVSRIE